MTTDDAGHEAANAGQYEVIHREAVKTIIDRVLQVPTRYRGFRISLDQARQLYAIQDDLLAELLDLGLPHRGSGPGQMFNGVDLENIGNALGLRFPGWRMLRMLAITFGGLRDPAGITYRIRAVNKCPTPKHDGSCDIAPSPMLGNSGAQILECDASGVTADVRLPDVRQSIAATVEPLIRLAGGLTFHNLPNELSRDIGFAMNTGLADCRLSTAVLVANGDRIDRPLRAASGMIMSVPFIMRHTWVEINVAGDWLSIDPFFLIALARWRIIDPLVWPADTPIGHIYWPLAGDSSGDHFLTVDHGVRSQAIARILNWRDIFVLG